MTERDQPFLRNGADESVRVGVIGVGSMGANHARVYRQLPEATLVGVVDWDEERASEVAARNGTTATSRRELLDRVDAVSVAVPTEYHYGVVSDCLDAGVDILVEKPFVHDLSKGEELARRARSEGVVLQVGHIERFNPAVEAALDISGELDVISVTSRRLGPPVERAGNDGVVSDLMIHDIDVVLTLADEKPSSITAVGCQEGRYASAQLTFPDGLVSTLIASRITQRRVRELEITTENCQITVDYLDQSVRIHRQSEPEYTRSEGTLRYRNKSIVEQPIVESEEPLKRELGAFIEASRNNQTPPVTAEDGLAALEGVGQITAELEEASPQEVPSK
jgi:predicted dehydrogenase